SVSRWAGTSSPTRTGATVTEAEVCAPGSRNARLARLAAASTSPSRGGTTRSRTAWAAPAPGSPGAPAGRVSLVRLAVAAGAPVPGCPGGRRGQDVHGRADDRDGRAGLLGDQPGHRRQVGVLDREPGQMAVHRHEVAQREHLARGLAARPRGNAGARRPPAA